MKNKTTFSIKGYWLVLLLLLISFNKFNAQTVITLNQPETGNKIHFAQENVEFKTNYQYSATATENLHGFIHPGIPGETVFSTGENAESLLGRSLNTNLSAGSTAGNYSVTPSGGASYTIPIMVPKGSADMAPSIALTYNSQSPSGIAGRGWNITGLSSITRAAQSYYYDDFSEGANFSNPENFSIDGSIFKLNGTAPVVPKENPSYKITPNGNWGGAPVWFKVEADNGLIMEFGNTSDARFMTNDASTPIIWNMNKIYDQYGNYMEFKYDNSNRQPRIVQILYTGNTSMGLSPYNEVNFYYNNLAADETNEGFIDGSSIASKYILRNITTKTHGSIYREYDLAYTQNFYSLLKSITEKGRNGAEFNPTLFQYGGTAGPIAIDQSLTISGADVVGGPDFNNDGKSDILLWNKNYVNFQANTTSWEAKISNGNNGFSTYANGSVPAGSWQIGDDNTLGFPGRTFDFNGDGYEDILLSEVNNILGNVLLSKIKVVLVGAYYPNNKLEQNIFQGAEHVILGKNLFTGDFDGDGRDEIIFLSRSNTNSSYTAKLIDYNNGISNIWTISSPELLHIPLAKGIYTTDFDGDGKHEIMAVYKNDFISSTLGITNSCEITELSFQGSTHGEVLYSTNFPGYPNEYHTVYPGDFNGDGKTDLLTYANGNWNIGYSTGKWLIEEPFNFNYFNISNNGLKNVRIGDFNGDGKSDIFYSHYVPNNSNTAIDLYYSKGKQFKYEQHIYGSLINDVNIGDFNGDGKQEVFNRINIYNPVDIFSFYKNDKRLLLHGVSDGKARYTQINYRSLAQGGGGFYTNSIDVSYPHRDIQPAFNVVSSVKTENGIGGFITTDYKYKRAILNLHGKGFLGFKNTEQHSSTGSVVTLRNTLDASYAQLVPNQKSTYSSYPGTPDIVETYDIDVVENTSTNTIWNRQNKITTKNNIRNGFSTVKTFTWNNNNRTITSTLTNVGGVESIEEANQYNTISSLSGWRRLLLNQRTITTSRSGSPTVRKINYQYNSNAKLTQETTDAGTPFEITTNYNNINGFGLAQSITSSSSGVASRTQLLTYDTKGRFVTKERNSLSQTVNTTYNQIYGKVNTVTGIDGLLTKYEYDGFGRPVKATTPDGLVTTTSLKFEQSPSATYSLYSSTVQEQGKPYIKTYFDKFAREVETQTLGFSGEKIYTNTTYDGFGNVKSTTLPYSMQVTPVVSTNTYDATYKNRLLSTTNSIGSTQYSYGFSSGKLVLTKTFPDTKTKTTTTDFAGKLIKSIDAGGELEYEYSSAGQQVEVKLNGAWVSKMKYNLLGYQTELEDRNAGKTIYVNNNFGELTMQTDANMNIFTMTYDVLGRMTNKSGSGNTNTNNTYTYVQSGNGINQLEKVTETVGGISEEYTYDYLNRVIEQKETIDNKDYTTTYSYDGFSNIVNTTYPSGFVTTNKYNSLGYLTSVRNGNAIIWNGNAMNHYGQYTNIKLGNGINTIKEYDEYGLPKSFKAADPTLLDLEFEFDPQNGNLKSRYNGNKFLLEEFTYDGLDRLVKSAVKLTDVGLALTPINTNYGLNGNISFKDDAGHYTYDASKANAVLNIDQTSTNISLMEQLVKYNNFNSPYEITEGTHELKLYYGPSEQRKKTVFTDGTITTNRYFLGNYEIEEDDATGDQTQIHYIAGGDGLAAIYVIDPNDVGTMHYVYTDHLGSILTLTDGNGNIELEQNFDAWGRERKADSWNYQGATPVGSHANFEWLTRGYTGHEHLSEFKLINMNGRVYDPVVARMLSVDNFVQDATSTQAFNRYSYVMNNPLKYTDPSGEYALVDDIIAGAIGGLINLGVNAYQGNLSGHGLWGGIGRGFSAFGSGAVGGVGALYPQFGGWIWGGATVGATNAWLSGATTGKEIAIGAGVGAVSGVVGGAAGQWGGKYLGGVIINSTQITSPVLQGTITGVAGGAVGGYSGGFTGGLIMTGDFGQANEAGINGLWTGAAVGGVVGGGSGYKYAVDNNINPWNGNLKLYSQSQYNFTPDPSGDNVTMYRGTTGSEGNGGPLFMTDSPDHAATYVKNGGKVITVKISRSTYMQMEFNGHIQMFKGGHAGSYGNEYMIHQSIVKDVLNISK